MKTFNHKSKFIIKALDFLNKSTLSLLIVSLLQLNTSFAASNKKDLKQNQSANIQLCEEWFIKEQDELSLPWYELKKTNQSFTSILFGQSLNNEQETAQKIFSFASKIKGDSDKDKLISFFSKMADCESYVAATDMENYSKSNMDSFANPVQKNTDSTEKVNAAQASCIQQTDQSSIQTCLQNAQSQKGVTCTHEGWETHDYLQCKKLATFITGFSVGQAAMEIQQTYRAGASQIDAQQELTAKQYTDEGIGMTDTLEVQKNSLEQQGGMAYEMAAYNTAKAGILLSMVNNFPTLEQMLYRCTDGLKGQASQGLQLLFSKTLTYMNTLVQSAAQAPGQATNNPQRPQDKQSKDYQSFFTNAVQALVSAQVPGSSSDGKITVEDLFNNEGDSYDLVYQRIYSNNDLDKGILTLCETNVSNNNHFFLNQEAITQVREVALSAGMQAIANGAQGALLEKQVGIIDDAIDDIEEFEAPDFEQLTYNPLSSECLVDPDAEGCIDYSTGISNGFGSQSFNSSASGSANLGSGSLSGSSSDSTSSAAATDRDLLPTSFGSVKIGTPSDNSFVDGTVRAGTIKPGQGGGGGGGGGSGAGGASLPSGGGGGASPGAGTRAAASSGSSAIKIGTSGGGGIGRVTGGTGSIGKKTSSSENPFAKLLGKNSAGASTLNFRGPAQIANKNGSLFQRISTRYQAVSEDDKLLKYEAATD